ncbi:hypothetical protein GE061_019799 [Apolygus lucorum]|uniref:Uncharacterized protein n=1 Tax=Apolygus lucorum TaxID=248454 RepID=A0A8S9XC33_APOLU|nr:hypothetical protein GE061_019799 [Apolygus lucorum]
MNSSAWCSEKIVLLLAIRVYVDRRIVNKFVVVFLVIFRGFNLIERAVELLCLVPLQKLRKMKQVPKFCCFYGEPSMVAILELNLHGCLDALLSVRISALWFKRDAAELRIATLRMFVRSFFRPPPIQQDEDSGKT